MEELKEEKGYMRYKLSKKKHFYWVAMNICVIGGLFIFSLAILLALLFLLTGTIFIGAMVFLVIIIVLLMCIALFSCIGNSIVCKKIMCYEE